MLVAVARCCGCCNTLVDRQRWRVIRGKIWRGQRRASATAAVDAALKEEQAKAVLAKLHPTEAAAVRNAAAKAAQAAAAESKKAAAAAAAAAERGDNSCAESSADESQSLFGWHQEGAVEKDADRTAGLVCDDTDNGGDGSNKIVSGAHWQKGASQIKNGAGAKALDAMKQLLVFPKSPAVVESEQKNRSRLEQHFSLADAAAYLQQCAPDRAVAIKTRAARMTEIHREFKQEKESKSSGQQKQANNLESKAGVVSSEISFAPTAAPQSARASAKQLPLSPLLHPRASFLGIDAALFLSATALQFYASVCAPHDVCCLVSDASLFITRHVQVYSKVWAAWEWRRLAEHELMPHLRQSVLLLPEAGVAAAAAAAAALATWPWYFLRLIAHLHAYTMHHLISHAAGGCHDCTKMRAHL
jgi:hypothetical protein